MQRDETGRKVERKIPEEQDPEGKRAEYARKKQRGGKNDTKRQPGGAQQQGKENGKRKAVLCVRDSVIIAW